MKLASFERHGQAGFGLVVGSGIVDLVKAFGGQYADLRALLAAGALEQAGRFATQAPDFALADVTFLPVIPQPGKIWCAGLNYGEHVQETGRQVTEQPVFFLRVADSQVGHGVAIPRPPESVKLDYEGEIAVIIGKPGRRISEADAWTHIAGYACYNDASVRDWQMHTQQWCPGKNFWRIGAFGPWMVTADEIPAGTEMTLVTRLNGQEVQRATTAQLIHSIPRLHDCYDVAVVGLGPAGATLANLLALRGLSVLVLDREADIYRLPRAVHFDGECMRVFQTIGIAQELAPGLVIAPGMRFVAADGELLMDWTRPTQIGPQGWHASYRFHQPTLETALRRHLASHPQVDVRLRHDAFSIEPAADAVALRIEDLSTGRLLRTRARYVVGCDGARSTVRRWELMLMPGEDAATMTRPETIWPLLSRWVTPQDAELERPAVYTFHSVIARGWRNARLLIAGDAAHQTPPFMGQGMCAGIRDASNLAWKLADVMAGVAPEALLDTYESERSPHVREFIETAVRLGSVIQATDPEAARQRDAQMRANPRVITTPQPRLGPGAHDGAAPAGAIGEQPVLADGELLDDKVGYRHVLLVDPQWSGVDAGPQVVVVAADSPAARDWLARLQAGGVLLRPDRYVAGVAQDRAGLDRLVRMAAAREPLCV